MNDQVNHPSHYTQYKYEVIQLTRNLPFDEGNCAKYICRAPFKGKCLEDLNKSLWYAKDCLNSNVITNTVPDPVVVQFFIDTVATSSIPANTLFAELLRCVVSYSHCKTNAMKTHIEHLIDSIQNNKDWVNANQGISS